MEDCNWALVDELNRESETTINKASGTQLSTYTDNNTPADRPPFNPATDDVISPVWVSLIDYADIGHDDNISSYNYVNHPSHYNNYDTEVLIMMERIWGKEAAALWSEMTAFKYRMRMGTKPGEPIERDMEKENFYLNEYSKRNPKHLPFTVIIEDNEG